MRVKLACIFFFCFIVSIPYSNVLAVKSYKPEIANPFLESWRWRHFFELDGTGVKSITETYSGNILF